VDRELVLAILVAVLCGSALVLAGWYPLGAPVASSGRAFERQAWQRLWVPFAPALLILAALCGWALEEPESAEQVPNALLWSVLPFAAVVARAAWRAARSLRRAHEHPGVATVGLLRPRTVIAPYIAAHLDQAALAAAQEHERAHARHRDPLRLWLAQLGSDLLWPWPMASVRLRCWRRALELARDEEARLNGIEGSDLAAAILATLRLSHDSASLSAVSLGGEAFFVAERIARLMRPLETELPRHSPRGVWRLAPAAGLCVAVLLGSTFGERAVQAVLALV